MPANLTPEYHKADKWFKSATTDSERLLALEEMLRVIPKHKGTEHMCAELRRKLSKIKDAASSPKKGGGKHIDIFHVPKSGSGQVVLIGTPNCGKSSLVGALSNANVNIADYPFSTTEPVPGMAHYEDVPIELVDMPPISADYAAAGQIGTYRNCDIILIIVDLTAPVAEQLEISLNYLKSHRLLYDEQTPATDSDGNQLGKKALIAAAKMDEAQPDAISILEKLCPRRIDIVQTSAIIDETLDKLTAKMFDLLDIVRVYAKKPGKEPDMKDPFTLPRGSIVTDLAKVIHRELAEKLRSARAWGCAVHDGQNVHRTYELNDKDIIELHF
jgi:hypothetical protein